MSKDNRKTESEKALERAKALKAQPSDETYYERLLRQREYANSMYEYHLYADRLKEGKPYRSEVNHLSHLIENYEKLNGSAKNTTVDGISIGYEMDLPLPTESDGEKVEA